MSRSIANLFSRQLTAPRRRGRQFRLGLISAFEDRTLLSGLTATPLPLDLTAISGGAAVAISANEGAPLLQANDVEANVPPISGTIEGINFDEGAANSGFYNIPPDPHGAAGLGHVVSVVNTSIEWHTKAGVQQNSQSLSSFFSSLTPLTGTFDPKVVYDDFNDRFVVITLERTTSPTLTSRILVAVSDNDDPNGTWHFQAIDSRMTVGGVDSWADYPGLAVDEDAIYITNNMFSFSANSSTGSRLWIVGKTGLYSGGASSVGVYDPSALSGQPGQSFTLQPAQMMTAGPGSTGTFLVSSSWTSGTSELIAVIRVDNPLSSPSFTNQFVDVGNLQTNFTAVPKAPQPGTTTLIDVGDSRIMNAAWRDNSLYLANTIVPLSGADANTATAHWYQLNTSVLSSISVTDQGNVGGEDIAAGTYTFYPSVAVNASGDLAIGFAAAGSTVYGGAYYTGRRSVDAAGTVQSTGVIAAGQDTYVRTFGSGRNRWGDYSATVIDPVDGSFWSFNEYAGTRGTAFGGEDGRWKTRWGHYSLNNLPVVNDQTLAALDENSPNGTVVGTVAASESDAGQTLTYSIIGGNTGGAFAINSATGQITVAATGALDFETTPTFNLTVQVTDNGTPVLSDTGVVTINLNDVFEGIIDPDDQISEATTVLTESSTNGSLSDGNDVDMYGFTVTAGQRVFFDIDARGVSPISDSVIRLFDAAGTQLAVDDDSDGLGPETNGLESFLRYTFSTAGTYYLGVSGYSNFGYNPNDGTGDAGSNSGDYALHIGTTRVLDDGEAGYTFVGSWAAGSGGFTGDTGGTTNDTKYVVADAIADRFARASFTGLTAGQYRVLATYRVGTTNSTTATYTMLSGVGGTVYGSGVLNQRNTPNDVSYTNAFNTKGFEQVAVIDVTGNSLLVQLSDQGLDRVWADGIMIERIGEVTPGPKAEVFDGAVAINDATGVASFGAVAPGVNVDKTFTVRNTGDSVLTVQPVTVSGTGFSILTNLAVNTVIPVGGSATFSIRFSQPASGVFNGSVTFNTNDVRADHQVYTFALTGQVTETQYIDDGDPGFSTVGVWANASGGRLTDIKYVAGAATATKFARWNFNIANPGQYRVMTTWRVGSTNATNANYKVLTGVGGTELAEAFLNQVFAPNDLTDATDSLAPNSKWEQIAVVNVSGSGLLVQLSDLANGRVYADSVRIERVGDLPAAPPQSVSTSTLLHPASSLFNDELLNSLLA